MTRRASRPLQALACLVALVTWIAPARAQEPPDPSADDIPGEIAIDLDDDLSEPELQSFQSSLGFASRISSFLSARTRILRASVAPPDVAETVRRLSTDRRVEGVEPVARVHASWIPNDPLLEKQWHLARVRAPEAWKWSAGRGVTVAIVDTGVACEDHGPFSRGSDLASTWCKQGFNFVDKTPHANDDNGHGTHVAGTVAQSTNNGLGAAGLAFAARILPVKVLSESGFGTTVDVADGIRFATDAGAHVINLSLGTSRPSRLMREAIGYAIEHGVVVVAAAGNNGHWVEYPGAFDGVIAVSATDASDKIARFSSRGKEVDIAAPGVGVVQQTICNHGRDRCERYPELSGTSMATPHVAAAAALLVSVGVHNPAAVEALLSRTARSVDGAGRGSPLYGAGLLDAGAAVSFAVLRDASVRIALAGVLTWLVARYVRRKGGHARPWRPGFLLGVLAFGPGLLFFAPFFAPRAWIALDLLSRPIVEWDMIAGASVHRWLPLANFILPLGLSAIGFGIPRMRPFIAGSAIGVASYLLSLPLIGTMATTSRGLVTLAGWAIVNALVCAWIARLSLDERPAP